MNEKRCFRDETDDYCPMRNMLSSIVIFIDDNRDRQMALSDENKNSTVSEEAKDHGSNSKVSTTNRNLVAYSNMSMGLFDR
jgi:hypothetical protein